MLEPHRKKKVEVSPFHFHLSLFVTTNRSYDFRSQKTIKWSIQSILYILPQLNYTDQGMDIKFI